MNTGAFKMLTSRLLGESIRVYALELTETSRNLRKKVMESTALYLWFSIIIVFSVIMSARLTIFEMNASFPIDMEQIFFAVFFLLMLKSSADFHRYFVNSRRIEYLFASPISHFRTSFGIFTLIFWINLGLWALFSSSYVLILFLYGTDVGYAGLYLKFTMGVILAILIGTTLAIHYFSTKRRLMAIPVMLLSTLWYFHRPEHILATIVLSSLYLLWALKISYLSFGYVTRKERRSSQTYAKRLRNPVEAMTWKETTLLWRERLVISFLVTAVSVGLGSGYLATHMDIGIFPPHIRPHIAPVLPYVFLFLGTFILSSYIFIFSTLNLFLAEEDTLWMLKNLPISGKSVVSGKLRATILALLTALAFPFHFSVFTDAKYIFLGISMVILSFFISAAISLPFGIRYAGKKSDVLLLYSVSILLFTLLSLGSYALYRLSFMGVPGLLITIFIIDWSAFFLYISLEYSGKMMDRKWAG